MKYCEDNPNWKGDLLWIVTGLFLISGGWFYADFELYSRLGALIALTGAALSLRVQKRTLSGALIQIQAAQKFTGAALLIIQEQSRLVTWTANQLGGVIKGSGSTPPWGDEPLKPIELGDAARLADIQTASSEWIAYNHRIEWIGTVYLWLGTIIWGFGDKIPMLIG